MDYLREYTNSDAFEHYKNLLSAYISGMEDDDFLNLYNELSRELRRSEVFMMDAFNYLMEGYTALEVLDHVNINCFDSSDAFVMCDETYDEWYSFNYEDLHDPCYVPDCDADSMAYELLNLDISKYTEITDRVVLIMIHDCEEDAGAEIDARFSAVQR